MEPRTPTDVLMLRGFARCNAARRAVMRNDVHEWECRGLGAFGTHLVSILGVAAALVSPLVAEEMNLARAPATIVAPTPPVAKIIPRTFEEHHRLRFDDYDWLRDRGDPDTLAYLKAENAYAAAHVRPLQPLIDEIGRELDERDDGASQSTDFSDGGYLYRRRIAKGARFPAIVRRKPVAGAPEQVVLDIERLAAGHKQYDLSAYVVSPDGNRVAFAVDFTGGRSHRVFVRDIASGEVQDTGINGAASDMVFSADSAWLFYIRVEPGTVRSSALWRHRLGTPSQRDELVYKERDATYELSLSRTKSGRFILFKAAQQQTTEIRYLPADRPLGTFAVIEPRRQGVIYDADHIGSTFYFRTNLNAPDYRLVRAPESAPGTANWVDVIGETRGRLIAEFELFDSFIALVDEHDAVESARVVRLADMHELAVPLPEIGVAEISFAQGAANRDASAILQLRFSGPLHPPAEYDFDVRTGQLSLRRKSRAWRWFDPGRYAAKRINAVAPDGETIPVTLMYRTDQLRTGGNPVLISGYGAYGSSSQPEFPDSWVSLMDRGFVYAQAHVRGGGEKGRLWHDRGRMLQKRNSFTDFIAATEALIAQGIADPRRVFAQGASAGGLLVAAVTNLRPELYAGVVAEVPFVDVVTTMADPTTPLTTLEYDEWGNPAQREHYDYMLSYSPYDNIAAMAYPAMFVTAALHDSQVFYHEPAKWVARIRATKTNSTELLFVTDMAAGHSGLAGRFGSTAENAQILAWLIGQASRRR